MLAWVLNTFYLFEVFYIIRLLKSVSFVMYFTSFKSSIMLLYIYSLNHMTYEILFRCLKQKRLLATY